MKRPLLLGLAICISLGIAACSQEKKEEVVVKKEEYTQEDYLTDEEMEEIGEKQEEHLNENIKYRFAKVTEVNNTKIDIEFTNTPQGYDDKGYSEDLNVDISKLNTTGEAKNIDLIGVNTNFTSLEDLKVGIIVRIGTYEPNPEDNEFDFEQGMVISVDII